MNYKGRKVKKKCIICKKTFWVFPYRKDTAKVCSRKCAAKIPRHYSEKEINRRKKFRLENPLKPWLGKRGKEVPAYKHGKSRAYKTGYWSANYKKWRMAVFERDGYKCQGCEQVGGYLTTHHIKSFAKYPKLRFDIDNGITLCEECHKLTDNYKGHNKRKQT